MSMEDMSGERGLHDPSLQQPRILYLGHESQNHLMDDVTKAPSYELRPDSLKIWDNTWGHCEIGEKPHDRLLLDLAHSPLFQRLQSIEQLTLGDDFATMPNTTRFSRWQHIWGSLVFVRKMTEGRTDMSDRQKAVLELRTLLSDVGHTAFSHLGDWLFQGHDGGENLHDEDLKELLQVSGVGDMIQDAGFSLDETVFPDVEDWVECGSPELCVDRVDYGMREILRWVSPTIPMYSLERTMEDPQSMFTIDDQNRLVMNHPIHARLFAAGFSLLPTEHWVHPTHRLQLQLLESAIRSALVEDAVDHRAHPREELYGIDSDFSHHFQTWDMVFLSDTMKQLANWQRKIFVQGRRADLNSIFMGIDEPDWEFPTFPDPLATYTWQSRNFSRPYPPHIDIARDDAINTPTLSNDNRGLVLELPPLKARAVDPRVGDAHSSQPLSEIDPSFARYLAEQRETMARGYRATVLMRPDVAQRIVDQHRQSEQQWPWLLERERNPENMRRKIAEAALMTQIRGLEYMHKS